MPSDCVVLIPSILAGSPLRRHLEVAALVLFQCTQGESVVALALSSYGYRERHHILAPLDTGKTRELGQPQKGTFIRKKTGKILPKTGNEANRKLQDEFKNYLELTGERTELRNARTGHGKTRVKNGSEVKIQRSKRYNELCF